MNIFLFYFFLFFLYSIIGWIIETTYVAIIDKRFVNRGFLIGPYIPIYGSSAIIMIFYLTQYKENPLTVLLLAMFLLVRDPLTYMKKADAEEINRYKQLVVEQGTSMSQTYPEISIIRYVKENNILDSNLYINTNFFGLDLSQVPKENSRDYKVYIIPVLYVISSFISIKFTTKKTEEVKEKDCNKKETEEQIPQMNSTMTWFIPIMAVTISFVAPLGLALYWLVNNILTIFERVFADKMLKDEN